MSHQDLIERILAEHIGKVKGGLETLRMMLEEAAQAVPAVPDSAEVAQEIASSIPEPEPPPPPPPPPPAPALNNNLLYRMASIEYADNQSEILNQLVAGLSEFATRGVLFVVRGDVAQAWSSFGFEAADAVKQWKVNVNQDPLLRTVFSSRARMLMDNTVPAFIPEQAAVRRSLISPLLLKGKVLAFLYADSGTDGKLDHYGTDVLIRAASLVIDIFPLRSKREPLPPTLEMQDIILPGAKPGGAQAEGPLFEDSGTLDAQEAEELPGNQTMLAEIPDEAMASGERERVEMPEADQVEAAEPEVEAVPEPVAEQTAPEPEVLALEEPEPEVVPVPPPPPPPPEEPPIPPEEQKVHQDAERFARLLVQEIVLYHPREVDQGRNQRNLYQILREDIERSREAFEHRFTKPSVRQRDYFNKALVKYLAEGNASLLGN